MVKAGKHPLKEPKTDYELNNCSLESIKKSITINRDINLREISTQKGQESKLPISALINK